MVGVGQVRLLCPCASVSFPMQQERCSALLEEMLTPGIYHTGDRTLLAISKEPGKLSDPCSSTYL